MQIDEIAKMIKNAGGELFLVGGAVRDSLLNIDISDEDYLVVNLDESEFIKLFPSANSRGNSFKVFDIDGKEFALARKEIKTGKGHKKFSITSDKNVTVEEDLRKKRYNNKCYCNECFN